MKNIIDYIREMEGVATPCNTIGMGNPMPPGENAPGSEPINNITKKKKRKKLTEEPTHLQK